MMPILDLKNKKVERTFLENVKFRATQAKDWTVEKVRNTVNYVKEDPERAMKAIGVVTLVTGGLTKGLYAVNKHRALKADKYHHEREIYDHSSGMYCELRRKKTQAMIDQMNKLKREKGYTTSEALSEMNVLKRR